MYRPSCVPPPRSLVGLWLLRLSLGLLPLGLGLLVLELLLARARIAVHFEADQQLDIAWRPALQGGLRAALLLVRRRRYPMLGELFARLRLAPHAAFHRPALVAHHLDRRAACRLHVVGGDLIGN